MQVHISDQEDNRLADRLQRLLNANHARHIRWDPADRPKPLSIELRDENGAFIGGLVGNTQYGWLEVEKLAVREAFRGKGYGSDLLRRAEGEAKRRGCRGVELGTMGHEAPDFYAKQGYRQIRVRKDLYGNDDYLFGKEFPEVAFKTPPSELPADLKLPQEGED